MTPGKSGRQIAKENAERLAEWLEAHKDSLPRHRDGKLNLSELARLADQDPQMFRTNPAAKQLLQKYGAIFTNRASLPSDGQVSEMLRQKDAENSRLRDLLAKRELELSKLRQEVQLLRKLKALHETTVETMRHVKPPPGSLPPGSIKFTPTDYHLDEAPPT